jgi:hypothetical protein
MVDQEGISFLMGVSAIGGSLFVVLLGWLPLWILFGVFIIAGLMYNSKFFATAIVGGFASGTFTAVGWLPAFAYFTAVVLATVLLATRIADKYLNLVSKS